MRFRVIEQDMRLDEFCRLEQRAVDEHKAWFADDGANQHGRGDQCGQPGLVEHKRDDVERNDDDLINGQRAVVDFFESIHIIFSEILK
jgi:hypothetical protein